jgi:hypothetical protein
MMRRYVVINTANDAPGKPGYFSRPFVPVSPSGFVTRELPVPEPYMYQFIEYAITGLPLGENSMVKAGAWKSGKEWREKRQAIMTYLDNECRHIKDSKLNPQGIDYWSEWYSEHKRPAPAPAMQIAENMAETAHGSVNNDHVDDGEVVDTQEATQNSEIDGL